MSVANKEGAEATFHELRRAVPVLKSSLGDLFKVASEAVARQQSLESNGPASLPPAESFDTALENFFQHCDHVSHLFATACDCYNITDAAKVFNAPSIPAAPSNGVGGSLVSAGLNEQAYVAVVESLSRQVTSMEDLLKLLESTVAEFSLPSAPVH